MTRERAKELLPIITAFADGKQAELMNSIGEWRKVEDPNWLNGCVYRIAPEPKLRPWTAEEVPLGAVFKNFERDKGDGPVWLSVEKDRFLGVQLGNAADRVSFESLAKSFQHSTDGGKTWKPCGVVEGEK